MSATKESRATRRAKKFGHTASDAQVARIVDVAAPASTGGFAFMPVPVSDLDRAFGAAGGTIAKLMPAYADIPAEFKNWNRPTKWNEVQRQWFYQGLPGATEFAVKTGIDFKEAIRHLQTIQGSFEPKHEHKEAGVAYLLSLWFDDVKFPESPAPAPRSTP